MDDLVHAAMARWPNVPDMFGWLSLTATGQWRLHPDGKALSAGPNQGYPTGESISNPKILGFINRNYCHDTAGRWFFQNGPQRVFVRLDAAPLILSTVADGNQLQAHTGEPVTQISSWLLDDAGHLYARTNLGPGLIAGRDLMPVLDKLTTPDGAAPDFDQIMPPTGKFSTLMVIDPFQPTGSTGIPLQFYPADQVEAVLGFVRNPALGYA